MRGLPSQPVTCRQCKSQRGCPKDQLCHSCRITALTHRRKRHLWTTQLDEQLRRIYRSADCRAALSEGITHVQRLTGFPRSVIVSRAADLGLASRRGEPWRPHEFAALHRKAGVRPVSLIARDLGRSYYSVKGQLSRLRLSARVLDGYSQDDLRNLLGVSGRRVRRWIELGWLKTRGGRIREDDLTHFLRRHPDEYQLNRVEEGWFKGLIFPAFNSANLHNRG